MFSFRFPVSCFLLPLSLRILLHIKCTRVGVHHYHIQWWWVYMNINLQLLISRSFSLMFVRYQMTERDVWCVNVLILSCLLVSHGTRVSNADDVQSLSAASPRWCISLHLHYLVGNYRNFVVCLCYLLMIIIVCAYVCAGDFSWGLECDAFLMSEGKGNRETRKIHNRNRTKLWVIQQTWTIVVLWVHLGIHCVLGLLILSSRIPIVSPVIFLTSVR